jgi:hypothetical protein
VGTGYQGSSVSISSDGNTAIVGGAGDNSFKGATWVFTRSGGVWTQQGPKLVGTGAVGTTQQGLSVSITSDGNTAIVGGVGDNSYTGAAWVFKRSSGVWTQQGQKLVGSGAVGNASQGRVSISSDGNTAIVGGYWDNSGIGAAWIFSKGLSITSPQAGEKWIAGERDTIKWIGGQAEQFVSLEYSVDNGQTYNIIDIATAADSHYYVWNIPNNLLSTKCKIKITDVQTSAELAVSDTFKIKPYIITRMEDGEYVAYHRSTDAWNFSNNRPDMWPASWFNQFNYRGIDIFTSQQYPQDGFIAFKVAPDSIHPDWVSWVNTFGINACYLNVQAPVYLLTAILRWQRSNNIWNGSCFGIAAANALAFSHRGQFLTKYPNFPSFSNPINVTASNPVRKVINELFAHQFGKPSQTKRNGYNPTPTQTMNDLKRMLRDDNVNIMTLSFWRNNNPPSGGHNVLAYRLDQDPNLLNRYYIRLYDNTNPTSTNPITIDTAANNGNGSWGTPDWFNWGGNKWIKLEDSAVVYLQNATLDKGLQSPFVMGDTELEIGVNYGLATKISNDNGQVTGFINNIVYEEIEGSHALIVTNGNITPPYGFYLPVDNYSVVLDEFIIEDVESSFFTGNKSFVYSRSNALQIQSDRLFFDGGLSVINPDAQVKTINLLNLINETTQEKLFTFSGIELEQNDSLKILNLDDNTIDIISYGTAKDYQIDLYYGSQIGVDKFQNSNIQLSANTTHKLVPNWTDITNLQLKIYVDEGNDGTIDDTLYIENTVDVKDEGNLLSPNEYNLAQNYPNPFNPSTKISWQSPVGSYQTLKIYDVLGNEVATLVNEYREAGRYEVTFDASNLASGIYFYRLQAGSFVETKKMLMLK